MGTSPSSTNTALNAQGLRFGIVAARYNEGIVDRLLEGALGSLQRHGASPADLEVIRVPGAFEIPGALKALAARGSIDGLIALGAVIRGGTAHFEYVCSACTTGCQTVALESGLPVGFGVLTCDNNEQAEERSGGRVGNKGEEAAISALEMIDVYRQLKQAAQ